MEKQPLQVCTLALSVNRKYYDKADFAHFVFTSRTRHLYYENLSFMFGRDIFKMLIRDGETPMSSCSDLQLFTLIRQNNQQAFEVIFERYWDQLFDLVFARIHSIDPSAIIVQDIFITLWLKRKILSTGNLWDYLVAEAITRSLNYCNELQKNLET